MKALLKTHGAALVVLMAFALLVRLPFFFMPIINWDESAYLIIGEDLAHGHLPYARYWTLKPPLGFGFYAAVIAVFGNSIVAVRAAASVWLGVCAWLVYASGVRLSGRLAGMAGALAFILYGSYFQKAVLMEMVALLPLSLMAWQLVQNRPDMRKLGLALGCAVMIRTNLATLGPALLACVWLHAQGRDAFLRQAARLCAWATLPVVAISLVYAASGLWPIYWDTMVGWSVKYAVSRIGKMQAAPGLAYMTQACLASTLFAVVFMLWYFRQRSWSEAPGVAALFLCHLGAVASMYVVGGLYDHYFAQTLPFVAVMLGVALAEMAKQRHLRVAAGVLAVLLCVEVKPYFYSMENGWDAWEIQPIAKAAAYARAQGMQGKYVYAPDTAVFHFITGTHMPTKYVHHISFAYQKPEEIFFQMPEYMIFIAGRDRSMDYFRAYLRNHYTLLHKEADFTVYKALDNE
ncbi:MAG: glycosyltransferase family 39 protein [Rickettsiales bacterium]|nr:glycosyltransferase family 39 protein [Rickettsiales bacterium]